VEAVEAEVLRWNRSRQLEARRPKVSTIQLKGLHTNIQQININKIIKHTIIQVGETNLSKGKSVSKWRTHSGLATCWTRA
jgi:hypothetical protein